MHEHVREGEDVMAAWTSWSRTRRYREERGSEGGRRERGRREGRRCAEGERARKLNGNMMNGWRMKESEEMSVRVGGGGEEESLSSEDDSGWKGKD